MENTHELAMLAAQMWGEANAEGADPEQFGTDVAEAYQGAVNSMEYIATADLRGIAAMRVV